MAELSSPSDFSDQLRETLTFEGFRDLNVGGSGSGVVEEMKKDLEHDLHPYDRYVYLLMDPTPEWKDPSYFDREIWGKFLKSVFYVGKGTGYRSKRHKADAKGAYQNLEMRDWSGVSNERILKLLNFWRGQTGFLSLKYLNDFIVEEDLEEVEKMLTALCQHLQMRKQRSGLIMTLLDKDKYEVRKIRQDISDAEALTCEAAIIRALTTSHLKNQQVGSIRFRSERSHQWTPERIFKLGIELLRVSFKTTIDEWKRPYYQFPENLLSDYSDWSQ